MNDEYKEIPQKDAKYSKMDDGEPSGTVMMDDKLYSKETTLYVICDEPQKNKGDINKITYNDVDGKWEFDDVELVENTKLCGKLFIIILW